MKLAFDAKRAFNNGTGLGNHARILLNALMRDYADNEYLLFTPKLNDRFFHQLQGEYKLMMPESKLHQSLHSLWRSYGLTKQVQRERVDIYHGLSNELPFNIHQSGVKSVVTIHDLIFLKHTAQYPWLDRQFYTAKTKYAVKHADAVIAVSEETKRDLIEIYQVPADKITVIYPSVEPVFYDSSLQNKHTDVKAKYNLPAKYILNVGSFFPRKNQATLIEAFDRIKNEVQEDLVLIGGAGNTLAAIQKLIAEKHLQNRVHITSNVSNEDLPAIYQQASVFVFPSLLEGFGAPVLEALFSKTPVVATKGGAIEEAAGKHSLLINPCSADEIAEAIKRVLKDDALRSKMVNEGYAHAMTMADSVWSAKTMEVYRKLL